MLFSLILGKNYAVFLGAGYEEPLHLSLVRYHDKINCRLVLLVFIIYKIKKILVITKISE